MGDSTIALGVSGRGKILNLLYAYQGGERFNIYIRSIREGGDSTFILGVPRREDVFWWVRVSTLLFHETNIFEVISCLKTEN